MSGASRSRRRLVPRKLRLASLALRSGAGCARVSDGLRARGRRARIYDPRPAPFFGKNVAVTDAAGLNRDSDASGVRITHTFFDQFEIPASALHAYLLHEQNLTSAEKLCSALLAQSQKLMPTPPSQYRAGLIVRELAGGGVRSANRPPRAAQAEDRVTVRFRRSAGWDRR